MLKHILVLHPAAFSFAWRKFALCLAGISCLANAAAQAHGLASHPATNQFIIKLRADTTRQAASVGPRNRLAGLTLPDGRQLSYVRSMDGGSMVVRLPETVSQEEADALVEALLQNPEVEEAQVDKRLYPALVPNDPQYSRQWHLFEDTAGIRMQAAWDRQTGSSSVVIAVIDTGILPHAELDPARILPGYDFISDTFTANDGDGRDADPSDPGDAVAAGECGPLPNDPPTPQDSSWHGLLVTGIIAATSNNSSDIAGIDFAARILPVRVLGRCGGLVSDINAAIRWAAGLPVQNVPLNTTPAQVINLSLAGAGACSEKEQKAIDEAVAAGAVVVVAAGNEGQDVANFSPANCNNVITVGAVGRDGSLASYTNVGTQVDLVAPGGDGPLNQDDLITLWNTGTTSPGSDVLATTQGTSFTAAQVSAVAALMRAVNNTLTPATIEDVLRATTRSFPDGSCNTSLCGTGLLDASAALAGAADPQSVTKPASAGSGGGGGGGGCTLGSSRGVDPLLLFSLTFACIGLRWRNR